MDLHKAVRCYITKMIAQAGEGMKVLMLDEETLNIVSVVFSMSEMMQYEVYLVEKISVSREPLKYLRCICFIRPTKNNVSILLREFKDPKYAVYYLYFSNAISKQALKQLAEADEHEVVSDVQEFFADFLALSPFLFSLDIPVSLNEQRQIRADVLHRCTSGIAGVFLSIKKRPVIRYQGASNAARNLAESLRSTIAREEKLFDFRQSCNSTVLLILDRRQDPVSPLLNQWTYEAMVHELIGIKHNRVTLAGAPNIKDSMKEITLSREFDEFYCSNQYSNFGEIGSAIKRLVENFQAASKSVDTKSVESIQDLKNFLENYPVFRKASGTVETHVALVSELSRLVKVNALLEVSEAEQELVCQDKHSASLQQLRGLLNNPCVCLHDTLRLVLLYALRYESNRTELTGLLRMLVSRGVSNEDIQLVQQLLDYAGVRRRTGGGFDLFSATSGMGEQNGSRKATSAVASLTKRLVMGIKGVENVYAQHEPLLATVVGELIKGKLREGTFPTLADSAGDGDTGSRSAQLQNVVVFILGGATYEEVLAVHRLNSATLGVNVLLGATTMHNSRSFLNEVVGRLPLQPGSEGEDSEAVTAVGHRQPLPILRKSDGSRSRYSGVVKYELLQ